MENDDSGVDCNLSNHYLTVDPVWDDTKQNRSVTPKNIRGHCHSCACNGVFPHAFTPETVPWLAKQ